MDTVRETKRADELKEGDWTAPGGISALPAEVLHALTYPHPGGGGIRTHLVLREFGIQLPFDETCDADKLIGIATAEELESFRAGAKRAKRIADIRAFADWMEANPSVPIGRGVRMQHSPNPHGDVWNSGAEGIAEVRRVAELAAGRVFEDDERTDVTVDFGGSEYCLIAWHKDGRPADPAPALDADAQAFVDRMHEAADEVRKVLAADSAVIPVADGHVVHECCAKLDDAPHENFCAHYVPVGVADEGLVDEMPSEPRICDCDGAGRHIRGENCITTDAV